MSYIKCQQIKSHPRRVNQQSGFHGHATICLNIMKKRQSQKKATWILNKYIVKFVFHVALDVMLSQATPWLQVMLCFYLTICQYCLTLRVSKVCVCAHVCVCERVSAFAHWRACVNAWVRIDVPLPSHLGLRARPIYILSHSGNACTRGCLSILHTCHLAPDRMGWCEFYGAPHWVRMRLDHDSC